MPELDTVATGINGLNASLANVGIALTQTAVVISAFVIASNTGGQGIQKHVRMAAQTVGICALFLKAYAGIVTGTVGMF